MALTNVKLRDKVELTLPAHASDFIYIKRQVQGGGFTDTDYKISVRNLKGDALGYENDGAVPDPTGGSVYFNETDTELRGYDGADWHNLFTPFTIMSGYIEQNGAGNPTFTLGFNNTGVTPNFIRASTGLYEWDTTSLSLPPEKIFLSVVNNQQTKHITSLSITNKTDIRTFNQSGSTFEDGVLNFTSFEIKLYK